MLETLQQRNRACLACDLRRGCTQVVPGEGPALAPLVIVGEGPGSEEDRLGRPFVGPAGQLLDRILSAAGLPRSEAYLTNVVRCRTPGNRAPTAAEATTCTELWLRTELELLQPRLILTLGNTPTQLLLGTRQGISELRGTWHPYALPGRAAAVLPMFHPAYLLRQDSPRPGGPKSLTWQDIQAAARVLRGELDPAQHFDQNAAQPRLF
ncbi:uracil-DNA glycosylase [Deinococcus lacus]|uniref:Type-4 uracil-DNA glycosylase n=1 Tax=Deinococcus lacus TaxID=392561 RepID=A0ABW1YBF8_9DEIO